VVHAEPHDVVDRLGRADAFHQRVEGLVDHGHEDAVGDEAREVVALDGDLSELLREGLRRVVGLLRGDEPADDLD